MTTHKVVFTLVASPFHENQHNSFPQFLQRTQVLISNNLSVFSVLSPVFFQVLFAVVVVGEF